MAVAKRHRHKYHSIPLGSSNVWACALPDCNHYMPKHMADMVIGKNSICWECGGDMILHVENMKELQPRCDSCRGVIEEDPDIPMSPALKERIEQMVKGE